MWLFGALTGLDRVLLFSRCRLRSRLHDLARRYDGEEGAAYSSCSDSDGFRGGLRRSITWFQCFPRCLWERHQSCVLLWVYATSFTMFLMFLRDSRKEKYSAIPLMCWSLGAFFCNLFYYESTFRFYAAEGMTILAYIMWCSSLQHLHGRKLKMTYVFLVNGLEAAIIMKFYRYNQHHVCKESGNW